MTAIVSPLPRNGWSTANGTQTSLNDMSTEEVSRMFVPRKSAQRSTSSSSLSSNASTTTTTTTVSASSSQPNGVSNGDSTWAAKKKPARALWPSSKAEAVAGLTTARPQSVSANASGPSAASAISALHTPTSTLPSQHLPPVPSQQNGASRGQPPTETLAVLHLQPLNGTFERKTITVPYSPDLLRIGRQTNQKTLPTPLNGYFDSKVLSRQHAEIWSDRDGKIWIRDVKSSNGTFVNGKRLSQENRDSEPHPLKEADVLELGIDIVSEDQKTVVHHKVAARVEHAGFFGHGNAGLDISFGEVEGAVGGGLMGQPLAQNPRGRQPGQYTSINNSRVAVSNGAPVTNMPAAAYHAKWLQPVTMEQIVKRLNHELRQARIQSSNLQNAGDFIDAVIASDKPETVPLPPNPLMSPIKSIDNGKSRFASSPPAPPPQQPLPEAPVDIAIRDKLNELPALQPLLRRSDTERPKQPGSPSPTKAEQSNQILNLLEALTTAQKELTAQGEKLKEMEDALNREREERRIAEERAVRLESEHFDTSTSPSAVESRSNLGNDQGDRGADSDPSALQQRIELMRAEMDDMKAHMETYRHRAETAEEESHRDRQTLAEMVESIRRREAAARRKHSAKGNSATVDGNSKEVNAVDEDLSDLAELDANISDELERAEERLQGKAESSDRKSHLQNGTASSQMSITELQQLGQAAIAAAMSSENQNGDVADQHLDKSANHQTGMTAQRTRRQEQLSQTVPYASLIGVVLLGVGMMAYLNGWQKVSDR